MQQSDHLLPLPNPSPKGEGLKKCKSFSYPLLPLRGKGARGKRQKIGEEDGGWGFNKLDESTIRCQDQKLYPILMYPLILLKYTSLL